MTIRHLKIFVQVADTGTMSAAAKNLYMTQPSVSQAVRELEEHYHVLLFERFAKKLYITEAGRQLYRYARLVITQFDLLEEQMSSDHRRSRFRVGATISVGGSILSPVIRDFRQIFPDVDLYSYIGNTREVEERLLNTDLDVGIVEGFLKNPEGFSRNTELVRCLSLTISRSGTGLSAGCRIWCWWWRQGRRAVP